MNGLVPDAVERLTELCRSLRERGVATTPGDSVDAARVAELLGPADREDVRLALRALLVRRRRDLPVFDELFDAWWPGGVPAPNVSAGPRAVRPPASAGAELQVPIALPSTHDARGAKDFAVFGDDDLDALAAAAARIARRLRARPSRRWVRASRGGRVDPRRVVRQSLRSGGEPIELAFRARKRRRTKLVVLCDVSGSMDLYSRFLLQLLFALQHAFARVETFAFSTRLVRITEALARDEYREALDALARLPHGWSGGTKIGACLEAYLAAWPRALDRRTVVIVLSDGWDTGEPAALAGAMRAIRRRAGRVVWLNPLLGDPAYRPLTRGMQAALPHVDVFAPAHDLASLEALATHLSL